MQIMPIRPIEWQTTDKRTPRRQFRDMYEQQQRKRLPPIRFVVIEG